MCISKLTLYQLVSLISLEILIDIVFVVNIHAGYIERVIVTDDVDASLQSFTSATICSRECLRL